MTHNLCKCCLLAMILANRPIHNVLIPRWNPLCCWMLFRTLIRHAFTQTTNRPLDHLNQRPLPSNVTLIMLPDNVYRRTSPCTTSTCSCVSCPSSCPPWVSELPLLSFLCPCSALFVELAFAGPYFASAPLLQALLEPAQRDPGVRCRYSCSQFL